MGFAQEYVVFVFLACCGALQLAASLSRLEGLLFLPRRPLAMLSGVAVEVLVFVWFFTSRDRIVPDTKTGLAGTEQFVLFVLGCALALVFTLVVSSLVNPARRRKPPKGAVGLEALREVTYFRALQTSVGQQWKHWSKRTRR